MHGQAVLFIGGNSEGIHAARHWQVVRSNCSLVESQGCICKKHWSVLKLLSLVETLRDFKQESLTGGQTVLYLAWNTEGVYACKHSTAVKMYFSLVETLKCLCRQTLTGGQTVLFLDGNSKGVYAGKLWTVVNIVSLNENWGGRGGYLMAANIDWWSGCIVPWLKSWRWLCRYMLIIGQAMLFLGGNSKGVYAGIQ